MALTLEQKQLFDVLTQLQKEIATSVLSGMKPIDAYKASSGKAKTEAAMSVSVHQILSNHNVSAFIDSVRADSVSDAVMSRQEALERLSTLARTDLSDLVEFGSHELGADEDGKPIVQTAWRIRDSILQDPVKMAAIAEINAGRDGIKIKTHSPLHAIQQLAKMQGWESAQKHELSGPGGKSVQHEHTVTKKDIDDFIKGF